MSLFVGWLRRGGSVKKIVYHKENNNPKLGKEQQPTAIARNWCTPDFGLGRRDWFRIELQALLARVRWMRFVL